MGKAILRRTHCYFGEGFGEFFDEFFDEVFDEFFVKLFRYLRNVSVAQADGKPDVAFSSDGTLKSVELKIMNLRPDSKKSNQDLIWEEVIFSK